MKNIVICAYKGVGKSTLVKKLIAELTADPEIFGFSTKKFNDMLVDDVFSPIYIFPVGKEPVFEDKYLVGLGGLGTHYINPEVFDEIGVQLLTVPESKKANALIIMDEVGFLEANALKFRQKVLDCLTGDIPCLVMMKQKMDEPFMQEIKALPGIDFIDMTPENRDQIFDYVLKKVKK